MLMNYDTKLGDLVQNDIKLKDLTKDKQGAVKGPPKLSLPRWNDRLPNVKTAPK